ncbi:MULTISPECIES: glycoside hydrolase family 3 N-terminal domain-containing protein [unclassified Frondihabitans]|uniref:glycoside hydrolase family 3 N-terminal domain-containing protein n=1 Tax=unclassified Frondihabitans TaxID=2626248 RepID=UPI000FACE06D|nr:MULTISPECIES: glycoside hydrolase family 3 N-terminal domain-containing protein [unclassified Frondihabitans]RPE77824.1 beta-glucosidase [Frondihabitans sp. PhB153]RPF08103.1 beta-glucosidase [Frondihabitans sp. PhB161]
MNNEKEQRPGGGALFRNPAAPTTERVDDLLAVMTLSEKIGQMLQLDARGNLEGLILEKLGGSLLHASPLRMIESQALVQKTRLQIPLLMADDCIHGHSFWPGATIFPTQLGMASTWNADLIEKGARAAALEIAATGLHWTFSPVLCISRDLRWGRVDETFGEDPHLIGEFGAAMIRGYQGNGLDDPTAVLATAKHFAGYSETQGGRDASEADISPRKLRSWFLPPFERAVQEGCATFMLGYQAIDGVPVTANSWLLNDVLKGEWRFTGTLVTDWDNVGRMVWEQKVAANDVDAATTAVLAGNDLVMNTPQFFEAAQEAVASGTLSEDAIDDAVRRILTLKFDLGLFEDPRLPDEDAQRLLIGNPEHTRLNLEMARRSLVLLANDGTLPLLQSEPEDRAGQTAQKAILVVGPNAHDQHAQLGDWAGASGQVDWMDGGHPRHLTSTVLDGFQATAPEGWTVKHARGADIGSLTPDPEGETFPDGQPRPPLFVAAETNESLLTEAVAAARDADYIVAVLGDDISLTGEGRSTATLDLQGGQIALLDALVDTGTPVVLVLIQSKPSTLPASAMRAAAIVEAFNPGMQGGLAIAELIFGLIEPSGRLPISFARHAGQLPVYYNQLRGQHGNRYADLTQDPLFAFGEGLSYTSVRYSNLRIATPVLQSDGEIKATITLSNVGRRPALETVQVYIADQVTSVTWAEKELKAFVQVDLRPGEKIDVDISLPASSCTLVDATGHRILEPGDFELLVGSSSRGRDLQRATFKIEA